MGAKQVLQFQVRVDLEVMTMKGYSTFSRSPGLEPHYWMDEVYFYNLDIFFWRGGAVVYLFLFCHEYNIYKTQGKYYYFLNYFQIVYTALFKTVFWKRIWRWNHVWLQTHHLVYKLLLVAHLLLLFFRGFFYNQRDAYIIIKYWLN